MKEFTTPPITVTATVMGGALVALFNGVPYQRQINSVYVECDSADNQVEFYCGIIAEPSKIGGHPEGDKNTYMPPNKDVIPPGYPFFVRWPNASSGTAIARAVFTGKYL